MVDICHAFGCCPAPVAPCVPLQLCRACLPTPCPPPLPPITCPPPLPPCPPPPICPTPPPPVICPPLPPPCPPPKICPPPVVCPPPIICPLPLPPPPPPPPPQPCPPPPPAPICPAPIPKLMPTYTVPVINDCCCTCVTPCVYSQVRVHGAKIFSPLLATDVEYESKCNDANLKSIMEEHMTEDPTATKRAIQQAAEEKLFKKFNVICSKSDFSYVAYTDTFCQHSNDDVTCYAFKPLPEL
uniref:Ground-like domain-containing protein n=1 Tax=Setaria digitata TaxID=48799 RepID=A0A915PQL2_9BILA